jgi:hypothetical protein
MSYYHGNFNISVMNNYFILKIPGWKLQIFQNIRKRFLFIAQKFCSLNKLSLKMFNLSENKRISVGSCNDTVGYVTLVWLVRAD